MSIASFKITDPRWAGFTSNHPNATIFHHPKWAELLAECYGYRPLVMVLTDNAQTVYGGIPLLEVNSFLNGQQIVGLPFTDFCSPLATDDTILRNLTDSLENWRKEKKWSVVRINWPLKEKAGIFKEYPVRRHVTRLSMDYEKLFKSFRKGVKSSIHQAEKAGVQIRRGENWEDLRLFYDLHLNTRRRHGTPVQPLKFFRLLWERLLSQGFGFVLLAYKERRLLAGAVFLHWNKILTYKFSASDPNSWQLRPNNLILWHAIRWGCQNGFKILDWGKTDLDNESLLIFKRGWATEEQMMHYSVIADKPPGMSNQNFARRFLSPVIRHSPPWVCRLIGELFYKYAA